MKASYRYIKFIEDSDPEAKRWFCENKRHGDQLGEVTYYSEWRQWVIAFQPGCVFNNTCLNDISHFLGQLNQ